MKTLPEYQKFAKDLKELCQKHGIYIIGTCSSEGIYGEITLGEYGNPDSCLWAHAETQTRFEIDEDKSEMTLL